MTSMAVATNLLMLNLDIIQNVHGEISNVQKTEVHLNALKFYIKWKNASMQASWKKNCFSLHLVGAVLFNSNFTQSSICLYYQSCVLLGESKKKDSSALQTSGLYNFISIRKTVDLSNLKKKKTTLKQQTQTWISLNQNCQRFWFFS